MFKYGTIYREALRGNRIEVYQFCNATAAYSNILMKQIFRIIEGTSQNFIHSCPYNQIVIKNATLNSSLLFSVFPTGDYKFLIAYYTRDDEFIGNGTVMASFKSSNRDTFG